MQIQGLYKSISDFLEFTFFTMRDRFQNDSSTFVLADHKKESAWIADLYDALLVALQNHRENYLEHE